LLKKEEEEEEEEEEVSFASKLIRSQTFSKLI